MRAALLSLAALAVVGPTVAHAEPVLLISIDGLRPLDVTEAQQRGLRIPTLRRFMTEGAWASGVVGVLPTVTYPSHTTLITGASPARHGITGNTTFDPMQINQGGWYWYAADIKLPTLWSSASAAGLTVANVHWPVSVGAQGINWNLPQIWRTGHADDAKLVAALATPGLIDELETATGEHYTPGIDEDTEGDEQRGRFAIKLITAHKPDFATVYLTALDHTQHVTGPGSPDSHAALERIDAIVGQLVAAEQSAHPDAVIAVVSDHGFETTRSETNFFRAFIDAGLIHLNSQGNVTGWDAMPWNSGGSVAVVLARPDDAVLAARVYALLSAMTAEPANKIDAIIGKPQIARMGGNPQASFYANLSPSATSGGFKGLDAPVNGPTMTKGMHGYFPAAANLRSTFMLMGPRIPKGRALGEVDMRAIAPTLAAILKVHLAGAELPAISMTEKPR